MKDIPYINALIGVGRLTEEELTPGDPSTMILQSKANNWSKMRERFESKEYYEVRGKIMAECYIEGWNAKEIMGYFKTDVRQFYKFCDIRQLKSDRRINIKLYQ